MREREQRVQPYARQQCTYSTAHGRGQMANCEHRLSPSKKHHVFHSFATETLRRRRTENQTRECSSTETRNTKKRGKSDRMRDQAPKLGQKETKWQAPPDFTSKTRTSNYTNAKLRASCAIGFVDKRIFTKGTHQRTYPAFDTFWSQPVSRLFGWK